MKGHNSTYLSTNKTKFHFCPLLVNNKIDRNGSWIFVYKTIMASSIFSSFCSVSLLLLLAALISAGSKWRNIATAIEDDDMTLLPFGFASRVGTFDGCGLRPRRDETAKITVQNNCLSTIWPATITTVPGQNQLSTTGFELAPGASRLLTILTPWNGRVWARTRCSSNGERFICLTGDCGRGLECNGSGGVPPTTLAEFSLNDSNRNEDFYDLSLVDGFNIPASITMQGGTGPCKSSNCLADVNKVCPSELQVKSGNEVIGCQSACIAFKEPRYCCTGEFSDPSKCGPTNYTQIFTKSCPDAFTYSYDILSTFTCSNRPNYVITFCG